MLQGKIAVPVGMRTQAVFRFNRAPLGQARFEFPPDFRLQRIAGLEYGGRVTIIGRKAREEKSCGYQHGSSSVSL